MSDWVTLFDGETLNGWSTQGRISTWQVAGGVRLREDDEKAFAIEPGTGIMVNSPDGKTCDICTELVHGSVEVHVEFCVPAKSNSGVYLHGNYEIQILDSWGTPDSELKYGSCGGIYARWIEATKTPFDGEPPRTNASRPPGEWQTYDIVFHAPRFDTTGRKTANARYERIVHNGVVVHENFECTGPTRVARNFVDIPRGPLLLQGDHGPVAFRNIRWRLLD
jgi:hypothetical protein